VPGDFSSATFFLVAGALGGNDVTLTGLDMNDTQGDKAVVDMLKAMGARIDIGEDAIRVAGGELVGGEFDLNATPDALPAMAVAGCFARGTTRLVNVPQARLKETDRIAVMHQALSTLGGKVTELPDGLVIEHSELKGGNVHGHADHRVVMALAVAATACKKATTIDTAETAAVTFPNFTELMTSLGAKLRQREG
jgi:3-phosphoshikimate 1-carboxyvinyltransferase